MLDVSNFKELTTDRLMTRLIFILLLFTSFAVCAVAQQVTNTNMESWKYAYPVHYLELADSQSVAYVDQGEGPVLFFVHGLGSNLQAWQKNIDSLSQNFRCIAVDLPGYGKSSGGDLPYGMSYFADIVLACIDQLELEDVGLVGHSMGGQISIHVALRQHPSVKSIALLAPAGFEQFTAAEKQWFATYVRPEFIQAAPEAQIVRNFEINFHQMPDDARFMIEDRLAMRNSTADYLAYCQMIPKCVQAMLNEPVSEQLAELSLPTLVLFGAEDELIPNRILHPTMTTQGIAEYGAQQIPDAQLYLIPEAGHFVQWEQADKVNKLLKTFF